MLDIAFHRTSTRTIPRDLVPPPLGIITTVCQAHGATSSPPPKGRMYECGELLPVPRVGVFLLLPRAMPHPEVFCLQLSELFKMWKNTWVYFKCSKGILYG